jgi:hypothetical protein
MQRFVYRTLLMVLLGALSAAVRAEDEVALFNGAGKAEAYIDLSDDLTIYLWNGKPVAYLDRDRTSQRPLRAFCAAAHVESETA